MKSQSDQIDDPIPCSECNGTGKASATGKPTKTSYGDGSCPVCGGSGKVPAPTILAESKNRNCFVATAAFQNADAYEVEVLRRFRNEYLLPCSLGRGFTRFYYSVGPHLGTFVSAHPRLRAIIRSLLRSISHRIASSLPKNQKLSSRFETSSKVETNALEHSEDISR